MDEYEVYVIEEVNSMKQLKKYIMRVVLCFESLFFVWALVYGPHGITALTAMQEENKRLQETTVQLQTEVAALENTIVAWQTDPYYKEQVAREQLQMAGKDETIYYVS